MHEEGQAAEREAVQWYYGQGREAGRLQGGAEGELELVRTKEMLRAMLPPPPARIADVGGGAGIHASWLAVDGYDVVLVEPIGVHLEQASQAAAELGRPFRVCGGDARALPLTGGALDAVVMLGPLYHLTDRDDRVAAWREAGRVVCPGGLVAVAAISRFASLFDGLWRSFLAREPEFEAIVMRDLAEGQHRNPSRRRGWFTTAYFHHPGELCEEAEEAGLAFEGVRTIEGPGWLLPDLDARWADPDEREAILRAARLVESEPTLLGLSGHLLAVARRP